MASNTGWTSVGEPEITRRISLVAVCCSSASASRSDASASRFSASARRFSRSRTLELPLFSDLPATGRLAFAFARPRPIGFSLFLTGVTTAQRARAGYAKAPAWASRMGRILDDACEPDGYGPDAADKTDSWVNSG